MYDVPLYMSDTVRRHSIATSFLHMCTCVATWNISSICCKQQIEVNIIMVLGHGCHRLFLL